MFRLYTRMYTLGNFPDQKISIIMMADNIRPVLFNPLKHHLGFIRDYIKKFSKREHQQLRSDLLLIGDSVMDLYTGKLCVPDITGEIMGQLKGRLLLEKKKYFQYLDENNGYTTVVLSDQSSWVLRKGDDAVHYVHIHPARYSAHCIRVKAVTLRSAIATCIQVGAARKVTLADLNHVRKSFLGLSPLKQIYPAMARLLDMVGRD